MTQIVLVEKDPKARAAIRTSMEAEGHSVTEVADGAAVLKVLSERFWPQVVLVGQLTPDLPLVALLRAASETVDLRRHIFVVMESARPDLPADMMGELREGVEVLIVDRSACGGMDGGDASDASDAYVRCEFLEALAEASRCAEAL
jgi:CheY-like chemotaxis protein